MTTIQECFDTIPAVLKECDLEHVTVLLGLEQGVVVVHSNLVPEEVKMVLQQVMDTQLAKLNIQRQ